LIKAIAKSQQITLEDHLLSVSSLIFNLLDTNKQLKSLFSERDLRVLFAAGFFHDFGKLHPEFQKVLRGEENVWKRRRHEIFSIPFVDSLSSFFSDEEIVTIKYLILTHHKYLKTLEDKYLVLDEGGIEAASKFYNIEYETEMLKLPQSNVKSLCDTFIDTWFKMFQELFSFEFSNISRSLRQYPLLYIREKLPDPTNKLILFCGLLRAADHLSSAGVKEIPYFKENDFEYLDLVIPKKYSHQRVLNKSTEDCILVAPTGSGKTEAALLWIRSCMKEHGVGRVFFNLPFRSSINYMFIRIVQSFFKHNYNIYLDNEESSFFSARQNLFNVMHSTYRSFLNNILDHDLAGNVANIRDLVSYLWCPFMVQTPFQLLKYFYKVKFYEKGLISLYGSYLVFDEIHAYQPTIFVQILQVLKWLKLNFKVHILIMTATLPSAYIKKIQDVIGIKNLVRVKNREVPKKFRVRHKLNILPGSIEDHFSKILESYDANKSVLVIVNTVDKAIRLGSKLLKDSGINSDDVLIFHSRFTKHDRNNIESKLQNNCYKKVGGFILIATQVVEVSLDINFEVLYTEMAPLDCLLQRFGRTNRDGSYGTVPVYISREWGEYDHLIYGKSFLYETRKKLLAFVDSRKPLNLNNISKLMDLVYPEFPLENKFYDNQSLEVYEQNFYATLDELYNHEYTGVREQDFYSQFMGVTVIPYIYYEQFVENDTISEMTNFSISLSFESFMGLKNKGCIVSTKDRYDNVCHFVKCIYDSRVGLKKVPIFDIFI